MTATTRNIIEELKRAATEQGAGEAVRTIAGPALETWMRALDGKDADPGTARRPRHAHDGPPVHQGRRTHRRRRTQTRHGDRHRHGRPAPRVQQQDAADRNAQSRVRRPPHPSRRDPPRPRGAGGVRDGRPRQKARRGPSPNPTPSPPTSHGGTATGRPPPSPPSPHWTTTRKPASPSCRRRGRIRRYPHTCADRQKTAVASDGTRRRTPRRRGHAHHARHRNTGKHPRPLP